MPAPDGRSRPCPRCGALNSAGFERCVRCAGPLQPLAAGADLLHRGLDANALWGTKLLFALTMLVFVGQLAMQRGGFDVVLRGFSGATVRRFGGMDLTFAAVQAEPLRLLSAVFVHFSVLHVAFNMLALADLGRVAERGIGTARFVVAYLVTGVVGFAVGVGWYELIGKAAFTAGASGAVFGVNGLILGWLYMTRDRRWGGRDRRWVRYAATTAAYTVLINLFPFNVNNAAHVGGLFCGVAFGAYYAWRPRPGSQVWSNLGAIVGMALVVLSLVLAQRAGGRARDPWRDLMGAAAPPREDLASHLISSARSSSKTLSSPDDPQETP